jgi:Tol biopolymer transport system component
MIEDNAMNRMTGVLILAVALAGCRPEPQPAADGGQLLAAGLPVSTASPSAAGQDSSPMVVRRLWFYSDNLGFWGGPSPGGRYLTYADPMTGGLALHEFSTGENRQLTDGSSYAWASAFSPDGERVAYSSTNETGYDELRLIELDGSGSRIVYADESFDVHPVEWSSDGERVVVRLDGNDEVIREIGLVTVADGSLRVLKTLDHEAPFEISMSPDGRSVIYDYPTKDNPSASDIYVIDVETGDERLLVEHPADDRVLGWAPGGGHVLFLSDRTGTLGAWLLPVADGRPAGGARLVKPDMWRIAPLGFARNGSFYYGVPMDMTDVYVAAFDPETGQLIDQPTRISQSFFGSNEDVVWSRDGRYLAYLSKRDPLGRVGTNVIVTRSMDTGEQRELTPGIGPIYWPRWSPDGRSILVYNYETGNKGLFLVDVQTGEAEPAVRSGPDDYHLRAHWRADGRSIFCWTYSGDGMRIGIRDLESGAEEVLLHAAPDVGFIGDFAVSPDENRLAFVYRERQEDAGYSLMIMPTAGGEPRALLHFEAGTSWPQMIYWAPDGRHIYYKRHGTGDEYVDLWRVSAEGGEPERLDWYEDVGGRGMSFHPDGRRIALNRGEFGSEVWVMEDFLPATAGTSDEQ